MGEERLNSIPGFVAQLEGQRYSVDLNLIERLIMRAELFLELLTAGFQVTASAFQEYPGKRAQCLASLGLSS